MEVCSKAKLFILNQSRDVGRCFLRPNTKSARVFELTLALRQSLVLEFVVVLLEFSGEAQSGNGSWSPRRRIHRPGPGRIHLEVNQSRGPRQTWKIDPSALTKSHPRCTRQPLPTRAP